MTTPLQCSVQCGDGVRTRQVTCIGTVSRSSISEALCEGMRPSSSEACAGPSCQIETPVWTYEDWTKVEEYGIFILGQSLKYCKKRKKKEKKVGIRTRTLCKNVN